MCVCIYIYTHIYRDALYSLKNDNTIVIKGADKGSGVVVWDREYYLKEAHKQLSDEEVL